MKKGFSCPLPQTHHDTVQIAHGSGGRMTHELIERLLLPGFRNPVLDRLGDAAVLEEAQGRIAFTTDTYVVDPLFFPGGSIGDLAVNGTVNDLAVSGARPLGISCALIIEEGFPLADLERVVNDISRAAHRAGVSVVTGDTKVVGRGGCDKLFINTSGVGVIPPERDLGVHRIQPGDRLVVSGTMGDHGVAILASRKGLSFQTTVASDSAPLNGLVEVMLESTARVRVMRDPTRGGLAAVLNEFARATGLGIEIEEPLVPVGEPVRGACELLGIDPLHVANEGKLVAVVAEEDLDRLLSAMRAHPLGQESAAIGRVVEEHPGMVAGRTLMGSTRIIDMPLGEQLPRIC